MKKLLITLLVAIMAIGASFTFMACTKKHIVTFDLDGGTAAFELTQSVKNGEKVTKPATNPTKVNYTFAHWVKSGETAAYDFEVAVTADITLKAIYTSNFGTVDLSKALAFYNEIDSYSVNGNDTTIKSKVNIATNADMEVTTVIEKGASATTFKTVTVEITGSAKATYETALTTATYNNPVKLETNVIRIMRGDNRTVANAAGAYDFVTSDYTTNIPPSDEIAAVGTAACEAMEKTVGFYRYLQELNTAFEGVSIAANAITVSTTFTSALTPITDTSTANPSASIKNVFELVDSWIIVAEAASTSHGQTIMTMIQIKKADHKVMKVLLPYYHISEYHGNVATYRSGLNASLEALVEMASTTVYDNAKVGDNPITDGATGATLTANTVSNAANITFEYYNAVLKA